jgi:hypothetical protein
VLKLRVFLPLLLSLLLVSPAPAQQKGLPETRNAALRYWLAFADMQDPPQDKNLLIGYVASGDKPWDEAQLGAVLDQNESAILRMQRATKLPECDWGLDYTEGPTGSIANAVKGRALGRLNTLYGVRQEVRGDEVGAVASWLAGIRFSQDVAKGGPLVAALIANAGLLADLRAITRAAEAGKLSATQRHQVEATIRALPESPIDWGAALLIDQNSTEIGLQSVMTSPDPANAYEMLLGGAAPKGFTVPSAAEQEAHRKFNAANVAAMRLPPEQTAERLASLQSTLKTLNPLFQETTPSLKRVNNARLEFVKARQQLLQTLATK